MPLNNFGVVLDDWMYRCAQPDDNGLYCLELLHVDEIVTLNGVHFDRWSREQTVYDLPTFSVDLVLIRRIRDYLELIRQHGKHSATHCTHGRDRTGLVIGAWQLKYGGLSLEEVNAERAAYGVYGIVEIADDAINDALETLAKET